MCLKVTYLNLQNDVSPVIAVAELLAPRVSSLFCILATYTLLCDQLEGRLTYTSLFFPALVETEPVIQQCIECSRNYRTYIPGTICNLPDGLSVFYPTAQTKCPLCDENSYGTFMNTDLFPELA